MRWLLGLLGGPETVTGHVKVRGRASAGRGGRRALTGAEAEPGQLQSIGGLQGLRRTRNRFYPKASERNKPLNT